MVSGSIFAAVAPLPPPANDLSASAMSQIPRNLWGRLAAVRFAVFVVSLPQSLAISQ